MVASNDARRWLDQLSDNLAIVTPQVTLHQARDSVSDLVAVVRLDPLLSLQLFGFASSISPNRDAFQTLAAALKQVGIETFLDWTAELPRLDPASSASRTLMTILGDSLVTAGLLQHWHLARHIEWLEVDHWACVFSQTVRWMVAYKDPMLIEGIEYRISQGERVEAVYSQVFGFGLQDCNDAIAERYQLPNVGLLDAIAKVKANKMAAFKYQALAYYLPIAQQLAPLCRLEWGSEKFQKLVVRARAASLMNDFDKHLPIWLAQIARDYPIAPCAAPILAAFQYSGQIPQTLLTQSGSAASASPVKEVSTSASSGDKSEKPPEKAQSSVKDTGAHRRDQGDHQRRGDPAVLERFRIQLQASQSPFSTADQAYSRLVSVLIDGLGCSRALVALYQERIGQVRVRYRDSAQGKKNVPHLSFILPDTGIIAYLGSKPESFWMTPKRAPDAWPQLPNKMRQVVECDDFFVHSVHAKNRFQALVYVDTFEQDHPLTESEYRQFRDLIAQFAAMLDRI